jgi:hypothetical protein
LPRIKGVPAKDHSRIQGRSGKHQFVVEGDRLLTSGIIFRLTVVTSFLWLHASSQIEWRGGGVCYADVP